MTRSRILITVLGVSLVVAACGSSGTGTGGIVVKNAWARQSPAATDMGVVYLDITSKNTDSLIAVTVLTTVAKSAELHQDMPAVAAADTTVPSASMSDTTVAMAGTSGSGMDGAMTMKPVDKIDLPAGTSVSLKPGGYHIMLVGIAKPLLLGDKFELTLKFGSGVVKTVTVPVRESAP